MTAKEMFKKLGYDFGTYETFLNIRMWSYEKKGNEINEIYFYINQKEWTICLGSGEWENIDKIIQAINKQVEELGWNKC